MHLTVHEQRRLQQLAGATVQGFDQITGNAPGKVQRFILQAMINTLNDEEQEPQCL